MSKDFFDRIDRCIAGWRQVVASERWATADERMKEFYADTLGFLEELKLLRAVLDLDESAHYLDEDANTRAVFEAKKILEGNSSGG